MRHLLVDGGTLQRDDDDDDVDVDVDDDNSNSINQIKSNTNL